MNTEFNKIVKRIKDKRFWCKTFYDYYLNQVNIKKEGDGTKGVYLQEDIDLMLKELKELSEGQQFTLEVQKKKIYNLELENYELNKWRKKDERRNTNDAKNKKSP